MNSEFNLQQAAQPSNSKTDFETNPNPKGWQQGELVEITIVDLNHKGEGVGRWQGRVVFVPDTVPGDRLLVRLVRVKPGYAHGKLHQLLEASPHRVRPSCIVADKCGGCQWQHIDYAYQLEVKRNLVIQDLQRIGGLTPPVDRVLATLTSTAAANVTQNNSQNNAQEDIPNNIQNIQNDALKELNVSPSSLHLSYRNKATYPLARSKTSGQVQAGYYQKGSHELINLNQCPIQDVRLNPLLADVKQDIQRRGWSIYNEAQHQGKLRHLGLRIGRRTGEMLLTLVSKHPELPELELQAQEWMERYPQLVGVCLNLNPDRTNVIFGPNTRCVAGRPYLQEIFAGLCFQIQPTTFFQVNTDQAEALLWAIEAELALTGDEVLLDAYCGIGTLTLPLAKQLKQAIGIEVQAEAVQQAQLNAALNHITNASFCVGAVEKVLPTLALRPDIVLLDPPRKGCDSTVVQTLLTMQPDRIVYVSCNPSTLARDLKVLSQTYQLLRVQPVDFFPQTAHVECVAFLFKTDVS